MRTAEPIFKDGALDRLLYPSPKEFARRDRTSVHEGALVPAGTPEFHSLDPSMQRQMQHQGRSIDQISNSVNNLQDTMTDLKQSFNSLRIELNGPSRHMGGPGPNDGPGFDMIATVLKELKSKSEEIEKLKLEIEALKLKNRFMEGRNPNVDHAPQTNGALPEVRSPGLLQAGRKRAWPDAFTSGRPQVADSFDEEDMVDDLSLSEFPIHTAQIPFEDSRAISDGGAQTQSTSHSPYLGIEAGRQTENSSFHARGGQLAHPDESPAKRQRLGQTEVESVERPPVPEKRRVGRPRKSVSQATKPNIQTPDTTASHTQELTGSNPPVQVPVASSSPSSAPNPRGRPRRGRPPSRGPSARRDTAEKEQSTQNTATNGAASEASGQKNSDAPVNMANGDHSIGVNGAEDQVVEDEKRKAKVAARDVLTRMVMQREEAMETDETR